jgi:long-chain fatty acid transport protein
MRRTQVCLAMTVLAACLLGARQATAQGYGIYEQSSCAMGRAGATVASPCDDASAIFFNPAGLADIRQITISGGATFVGPGGDFTNATSGTRTDLEGVTVTVPAAYAALPLGERTTVGLGVFVPYGLETRWPATFEGRYLGYRSVLQSPYIQPTIAYKVSDRIAVGGGLDIVYTNLELERRVDLSTQRVPGTPFTFGNLGVPSGTDFADVNLRGKTWGAGVHVGVLVEPTEKFSFGARYLSQVSLDTDDGEFTPTQIQTGVRLPIGPGGALVPVDALLAPQFSGSGVLAVQSASTSITHPDQFVAGVAINVTPTAKLLIDYQYTNWADFDQIVVDTENGLTLTLEEEYDNTHGLRVGTDIAVSPLLTVRGGIDAHNAGAPDQNVTPNLPEAPRVEYNLGLGVNVSRALRVDAAYMYLDQENRTGRTLPSPAPNSGDYRFHAHLFGFSLVYRF